MFICGVCNAFIGAEILSNGVLIPESRYWKGMSAIEEAYCGPECSQIGHAHLYKDIHDEA